jgi:hypothetical protein
MLPIILAVTCSLQAEELQTYKELRVVLTSKFAELLAAQVDAIKGDDGIYFLTSEVRSYSRGKFWAEGAIKASVAGQNKDPQTAILEFYHMLKARDIDLILVPVPGKIAIYPDKLDSSLKPKCSDQTPYQQFYDLLRNDGVTVIDLTTQMHAMRDKGAPPFCKQDSHWSPEAVKLAARAIAEAMKTREWLKEIKTRKAVTAERSVEVQGDLVKLLKSDEPKEKLTVTDVLLDNQVVANDAASPVVLMGDSHTLVYHADDVDLVSAHAGLADHLAAELGFPVDLIGARGNGANTPRATLAHRKGNLDGKKCVIWCFAAREFTESSDGWKKIPFDR